MSDSKWFAVLFYRQVNSLCVSMLEELLFGGSPKYVAHQFALLYRALASTGLALQSFKIKVSIKKTFLFFCII